MPALVEAPLPPFSAAPPRSLVSFLRLLGHVSPIERERIILRSLLGYWPSFRKPRSFNEKLAHLRYLAPTDHFAPYADKLTVRQYVGDAVGKRFLNPLLAVGDSFDAIPWATLPSNFVVKATHGSAFNAFVHNPTPSTLDHVRDNARRWLTSEFGRDTHETWYALIPRRLIVEPIIIDTQSGQLLDYKFYVFRGRTGFIQVDLDRETNHRLNYYDRDWRQLPFTIYYPRGPGVPPPALLTDMLRIAERLARPFEFARVDLYSPDNNRIVFGEITFAPGAGRAPFRPSRDHDFWAGSLW